jgi:peroxiredoxin
MIFMPAAFTFNCPTEVEDAADNYAEFQKLGAEVYIVTTDTHFSHKVWHETSPAVGKAKFPLVGDPTHQLTRAFGVHIDEEGLALRGTFIVDPKGVDQDARDPRQRDRPRREGDAAQAEGRAVRRQEPGRGLPRQVERGRQDADPVAGAGRQDLTGPATTRDLT